MEINRANLDSLFNTYNTAFSQGAQTSGAAPGPNAVQLMQWAMEANVPGASVTHAWLNAVPSLEEWVGTRTVKQISSTPLTVVNKEYGSAVSVPRPVIETDQYGLYAPLIGALGNEAAQLWENMAIDALIANGTWADSAAFFVTTRKYGTNTINNKSTSALDATTFATAVQTMRSYRGVNNQPFNVQPRVLLVGPKLEKTAFDLVKNQFVTSGTGTGGNIQNWAQGLCQVQVSGRLVGDYDDYWFVLGEKSSIKPVFVQKRVMPTLDRQDDPNSDTVFLNNEFRYGARASGAAFLTLPHLAYAGIL